MFLESMNIVNFKGIKNLSINFVKKTKIQGKNGTGKTSIYNAYTWLFFGSIFENINESSKFGIKPIADNNAEISVEAKFDNFSLKKIQKKKKNGNEIFYFIDGFPTKEKKYVEYVNSIIEKQKFKILTNPLFFASLEWKDQRRMMMDLIDIKVTAINVEILNELKGHTEDELLLKLNSEKKIAAKELEMIPVRLSELEENNKINTEFTYEETLKLKSELMDELREYKKKDSVINEKIFKEKREIQQHLDNIHMIEREQEELIKLKDSFKQKKGFLQEFHKLYVTEKSKTFEINENDKKCKACNQNLPDDLYGLKFNKLKEAWEKDHSKLIEEMKNKGNELKAELNVISGQINKIYPESMDKDRKYWEDQMNKISADKDHEESIGKIKYIEDEIMKCNENLAKFQAYEKSEKRKIELEEQMEKCSQKHLLLEKQIYEVQDYLKHKIKSTQDALTKLFPKQISFKIFEKLENGNTRDCFEIMYNGNSWKDLSGGEKIITGMELIKVLSKKWEVSLPIWIDEYGCFTGDLETENQIIILEAVKGLNLTIS